MTPTHVVATPFPAETKQAASIVNGIRTEVLSLFLSDKIIVTIIQDGRLAQWVHIHYVPKLHLIRC